MRNHRLIAALAALIFCVSTAAAGLADGELTGLLDGLKALAFETHNVTIEGEAAFTRDGVRFKTAQIQYIQDGDNSSYQLRLFTPLDPVSTDADVETGWLIIANDEHIYVMEAYYPGTYREGTDGSQNTLLRRTAKTDAMFSLAESLLGILETTLPDGAVTVEQSAEGTATQILLTKNDAPAILNSGLTLAAQYFASRYFSVEEDRELIDMLYEDYTTTTELVLNTALSYQLYSLLLTVTTDSDGQITGCIGNAEVAATLYRGEVMNIGVQFSFTVSGRGESHVDTFDADALEVIPFTEWWNNNRRAW